VTRGMELHWCAGGEDFKKKDLEFSFECAEFKAPIRY
jgi:hypothetical protein